MFIHNHSQTSLVAEISDCKALIAKECNDNLVEPSVTRKLIYRGAGYSATAFLATYAFTSGFIQNLFFRDSDGIAVGTVFLALIAPAAMSEIMLQPSCRIKTINDLSEKTRATVMSLVDKLKKSGELQEVNSATPIQIVNAAFENIQFQKLSFRSELFPTPKVDEKKSLPEKNSAATLAYKRD